MRYLTYPEAVAKHIELMRALGEVHFLKLNGYEIDCPAADILELVLAIEADQWDLDRIAGWMRQHTKPFRRR